MSRTLIRNKFMNIQTFIKRASNKIIRRTAWYDRYWSGAIKFWSDSPFGLDCANFGSNSGLYGFDYSKAGVKGANWALGPQSLAHDFNILKNYFSFFKEGATVFIPICPFSCLYSQYNKQSNLKYYTFLHPATIIDFDENERTRALTIADYPFKAMPSFAIKQTIKEIVKDVLPKKHPQIDYMADATTMLNNWKSQFGIVDFSAPLSEKHQTEQNSRAALLHEMIEFCIERGLKPVVVLLPMHSVLKNQLSDEFRQHYVYGFVEKANIGDTPFIDGFKEVNFVDEDFRSSYFLSKQGAMKYTKRLCEQMLGGG